MAYYTTTVKSIIEGIMGYSRPIEYEDLPIAIPQCVYGGSLIVDTPIFSFLTEDELRNTAQGKLAVLFLYKYLTREICYETYGRWKAALLVEWAEKWDKWSRNFEVDELESKIDPMISYEHSRWGNNTNNNTSTSDGTGSTTGHSKNTNSYSDTPQGSISRVEDDTYLTNYTKVIDDNNGTSKDHNETTSNGSGDFKEQSKGTNMSYAKLLEEFRATSHADIEDFLAEFEDLFMGIF